MTQLCRFNPDGLQAFVRVMQQARVGGRISTPLPFLNDRSFAEPVEGGLEIELRSFSTRGELAAHLSPVLEQVRSPDLMRDTGLWAWLSAAFLDSVCPADRSGTRNPQADYRHVPTNDWRHFYRHLVRGPVRIYRLFDSDPARAAIVLCQNPAKPGDFVEQLCSRQERITNPAIIEVANRLYFDRVTGRPKRGSAPNSPKPGTLRRYTSTLDQLDLTYDLYSMTADDLMTVLPKEFSRYLPTSSDDLNVS
jgi:hypothetical protein